MIDEAERLSSEVWDRDSLEKSLTKASYLSHVLLKNLNHDYLVKQLEFCQSRITEALDNIHSLARYAATCKDANEYRDSQAWLDEQNAPIVEEMKKVEEAQTTWDLF